MLQEKKPPLWEAHGLQLESSTCLLQLEKAVLSNKEPVKQKPNIYIYMCVYIYI